MLSITWPTCMNVPATLQQFASRTYGDNPLQELLTKLVRDDYGFIVSTELVLVSTIAVLSMIVGLSQVSHAMNHELADVARVFGSSSHSVQTEDAAVAFGYRDSASFD
jgi:hypothetical protein